MAESEELFNDSELSENEISESEEELALTARKTVQLPTKKKTRALSSSSEFEKSHKRLRRSIPRDENYFQEEEAPASSKTRTPSGRPVLGEFRSTKHLQFSTAVNQESDSCSPTAVLSALGELTNTLNKVVKRLEKTEYRIKSMEQRIDSSTVSSSASDGRKKSPRVQVPVVVRVRHSLLDYKVIHAVNTMGKLMQICEKIGSPFHKIAAYLT